MSYTNDQLLKVGGMKEIISNLSSNNSSGGGGGGWATPSITAYEAKASSNASKYTCTVTYLNIPENSVFKFNSIFLDGKTSGMLGIAPKMETLSGNGRIFNLEITLPTGYTFKDVCGIWCEGTKLDPDNDYSGEAVWVWPIVQAQDSSSSESEGIKGVSSYSSNFYSTNFSSLADSQTISLSRWIKDPNKPSPGTSVFYLIDINLTIYFESGHRLESNNRVWTPDITKGYQTFSPNWHQGGSFLQNADSVIIINHPQHYFTINSTYLSCDYLTPILYNLTTNSKVDLGTKTRFSVSLTSHMFYS